VSYEILVLPVPPGAEIEEAGEALEVRLSGGHVVVDPSATAAARRRALAAVVAAADATLVPAAARPGRVGLQLADGCGTHVDIVESFIVFRVDYSLTESAAAAHFDRLFRVVGATVRETGWHVYDPQGACAVGADDAGRDATLEIYLSVVDQLLPDSGHQSG